jgi:hypothetical protein
VKSRPIGELVLTNIFCPADGNEAVTPIGRIAGIWSNRQGGTLGGFGSFGKLAFPKIDLTDFR